MPKLKIIIYSSLPACCVHLKSLVFHPSCFPTPHLAVTRPVPGAENQGWLLRALYYHIPAQNSAENV